MKQQKNILSLDAAFGSACACLIRQDGKSFHTTSASDKPHSQAILPMLESLLTEAGLDWKTLQFLGVGIGPGSFTGLRVAAAIMAGINSGLHLPILEISSLAITARQSHTREPIWVIEDARANSVWIGLYQEGIALEKDRSQTWGELRCMPTGTYLTQAMATVNLPGWKHLPLDLSRSEALSILTREQANQLNHPDKLPRTVIPTYLTPSQAERNARRG
ncbi:MAG: tRNA (adenosine(37)-N6)-threonylcarbamoyltransferase complex dimerization subunit type 1 TsaB [Mariprofundaceae bacterium]|nr:tRNA (adenosine(37)-N6)-threonylcarbamoyltransferase complex dimerization subunit type 1 TsaB [Mariprofundaceae bacterium]